jgi:hypothetical protein
MLLKLNMKDKLRNELKTQLETSLRALIIENMKNSDEIPEIFKGLMVMNVAGTFCQNIKDNYINFKLDFAKNWDEAGFSQKEYNSIIDEVTEKVLDEFIEPPKHQDRHYDTDFYMD